ncbi:MAG: hypothetical protein K0R94_1707 [Burkholderiales bacterium]|nr:hypothetical protein [Burkholderiales bacterium]
MKLSKKAILGIVGSICLIYNASASKIIRIYNFTPQNSEIKYVSNQCWNFSYSITNHLKDNPPNVASPHEYITVTHAENLVNYKSTSDTNIAEFPNEDWIIDSSYNLRRVTSED